MPRSYELESGGRIAWTPLGRAGGAPMTLRRWPPQFDRTSAGWLHEDWATVAPARNEKGLHTGVHNLRRFANAPAPISARFGLHSVLALVCGAHLKRLQINKLPTGTTIRRSGHEYEAAARRYTSAQEQSVLHDTKHRSRPPLPCFAATDASSVSSGCRTSSWLLPAART